MKTEWTSNIALCHIVSKLGYLVKASPNFYCVSLRYSKHHGGGGVGITDIPEHLPVFLLGTENIVG